MNRMRNITIILGATLVGLVLLPSRTLTDEASATFYKQKCASCFFPASSRFHCFASEWASPPKWTIRRARGSASPE
jgi:hypothetical protein